MNRILNPEPQTGVMMMNEFLCRPVSMWAVMYFFGMELTRIFYSCEFVKVDPPAVPTVIGMTGVILLPLVALGKR